ncbi:MmgE/PrpD family domain containing protein, putative [Eimeria tenella]|uniref:MmgE/PrpD family domain containing protein, putative n=1 Tax=Eimeria tenella TaxID=5802 RepID=U6L891_EIMTE|nr:MmgE/PrpD family domain containing protein, putative [Eimeria tenella]CDJ43980.1 MmgE/PrpD family domain containing protein, putative [Eimeria tenella]|eukprot:XP_013234729.1 MmgE/PrpD family domain containing protein, putative [Eimeria tenella]
MLGPEDYSDAAIRDPQTQAWIAKIECLHGGPEYDSEYPRGIPTKVTIHFEDKQLDSGKILFPAGHSCCSSSNFDLLLQHKFELLGRQALSAAALKEVQQQLLQLEAATPAEVLQLYEFKDLLLQQQ